MPSVIRIWNRCVASGDVLYAPMEQEMFHRTFTFPDYPACFLVAEDEDSHRVLGFLHYLYPGAFPLAVQDAGYLTVVMVDPECRGRKVGAQLLHAALASLRPLDATHVLLNNDNPYQLTWRIPDTPGYDHNNMPGVDQECTGHDFFLHEGFTVTASEVSLYMPLAAFRLSPEIQKTREALAKEGILTGFLDPSRPWDYDGMCDRVHSEYWRDVLRTELAAWHTDTPNADPRFWADGKRPSAPRPMLTAVKNGEIIGFTGPVDLQSSGRGWFTGICTDPRYQRKGIGTVLFSLLMDTFRSRGAAFASIFTGTDNRAQRIYIASGMQPVRIFDQLTLNL
ncbi:MAG: GNAT family N-acetyltransferase [Clostridia bacterium]|nr:GNAT family N-acetyltransferase [Clostridia bacterium]